MSCNSEQSETTPNQHLENMLENFNPKARYVSQMHVEQFIDSIYLQIINGDTEISSQQISYNQQGQKNGGFEQQLKKRILDQAEREKKALQDKLIYLDRSIHLLFKEDNHTKMHRHSISVSSPRQKQQWRSEIKERDKNLKKKKHDIEENKKKKEEELKEIEERLKKQKEQIKRKEINQHISNIKQRAKQREQLIKSANQRYTELKKTKNLHQKMNESFNERQSTMLEERKKKLAEIRNLHKPLDSAEIEQHEQKFLELKRQKEEMRERQKRMNESRSNSYQPFYRSAFYKRALQDSRNQIENTEIMKREKIKQFSEHVKESFAPEIDEKKRAAIEDFIENERRKVEEKYVKQHQLLGKSRKTGIEYLELIKKIPKKRKNHNNSMSVDNVASASRAKYQNYLVHNENSSQPSTKKWSQILADQSSNKQEKALFLQYESQRRQQQLKRKEQQIRLLKNGDSDELDNQYYNMIKAKLDLLQTEK